MDAKERVDRAIQLSPPAAGEVPVAPLLISFLGRLAGMKQAEIFSDLDAWRRAVPIAFERIGKPDMGFVIWPRDVAFGEGMNHLLPGRDLGDDEPFQIVEKEMMQREDYERLVQIGYDRWSMDYYVSLQPKLPAGMRGRATVTYQFIRMALRIRGNIARLARMGIPPAFCVAGYPPFDTFSMVRSLTPFCGDLRRCPELVQKACDASVEPIINTMLTSLRVTGGRRVCIYPMRTSATFISPKMFEKMALGHLKQMVEAFVTRGITPIIHCDANWTPLLHHFRELPRACCILELDDQTDIFKAKEVLGDWMCIKGNVPAQMLAFAETAEVEDHCERLIREVGRGGGFILGSSCEVPLNAKVDNVSAMMRVARGQARNRVASA